MTVHGRGFSRWTTTPARVGGALAVGLLTAALVGCGGDNGAATTCQEFGDLNDEGKRTALQDLAEAEGHDPQDQTVMANVVMDVVGYCGIDVATEEPSANLDESISQAVNWDTIQDAPFMRDPATP